MCTIEEVWAKWMLGLTPVKLSLRDTVLVKYVPSYMCVCVFTYMYTDISGAVMFMLTIRQHNIYKINIQLSEINCFSI